VDLKGKERLAYAIQGTESRALQVLYPTMELHPKFFVVVFFLFFFFSFCREREGEGKGEGSGRVESNPEV
jgi:hypothetical protein